MSESPDLNGQLTGSVVGGNVRLSVIADDGSVQCSIDFSPHRARSLAMKILESSDVAERQMPRLA